MNNEVPIQASRKVGFGGALVGFFLPLATVIALVTNGAPIVMALLVALCAALCAASMFSIHLGHRCQEVQTAAMIGLGRVFPATLLMILVGIMIAACIEAGSVPTLWE